MTDQTTQDARRGTTPADPGTNLTDQALTNDDRAALYPTPPYTDADVALIGQHLSPIPTDPPAARDDIARNVLHALVDAGWRAPARTVAADAPWHAGDAPTAAKPLPTLDDYLTSPRRLTPGGVRAALGCPAPRAQGPDDLTDRLAAALTDVNRHLHERGHPGRQCLRTGWIEIAEVERWRALLAEHADRSTADPATSEG